MDLVLLRHVRPLLADSPLSPGNVVDVLLAGGSIAALGAHLDTGTLPVQERDLEGRFVFPGLVDGHVISRRRRR